MTSTRRQYRDHDEPDDIGRATLSLRAAVLTILVLALLLWAVIWCAMEWTIGVLQG